MTLDSLLDEMVGLGILREVAQPSGSPYYTLRSPNVLLLIGIQADEIQRELDKPRELEAPYEAATFRAAYRGPESGRREKESANEQAGGRAPFDATAYP